MGTCPVRKCERKATIIQCERCHGFHSTRICIKAIRCSHCAATSHQTGDHPAKQCQSNDPHHQCPPRCANCLGPHPATDISCLLRPKQKNGVVTHPSRERTKDIRAEERLRAAAASRACLRLNGLANQATQADQALQAAIAATGTQPPLPLLMRTRPLSIYQANVGKGRANHLLALQLAYKHNFDIVCIQEPWVHREYHRKFVCSHPGFDSFVALDVWDADNKPRAVSYTRKGAGLQADQLRPYGPQPDIIVLKVNDLTVYNIYNSHAKENAASLMARAAHQPPAQKTVVLGDFNTHHRRWEPALTQAPTRQAQALIRWIDKRKLLVLNEPGQPTHSRGHVLDLALCTPDLLLRKASVMLDSTLDSTSDHSTLALTVPIAQRAPANTGRLLIGQIDKELYTSRLASYPLPQAPQLDTPEALDKEAADLTSAILSVAKC